MLRWLKLTNVGPAERMELSFAPRLNLLTGDNGLGKTFVLDVAWHALARSWAGSPLLPRADPNGQPDVRFATERKDGRRLESAFSGTDATQARLLPGPTPSEPALTLYLRAEGDLCAWDPARDFSYYGADAHEFSAPQHVTAYHFTSEELWNGLSSNGNVLCDGLLRDWLAWQSRKPERFDTLRRVLERLSPHPDELIRPGDPRRISVEDVREIPTIRLPYGEVPVTHASAGMKRVLSLAYAMVWSWFAHREASALLSRPPTDRMVLLIDDVEAHLHPQWQRMILPAVLEVAQSLMGQDGGKAQVQIIAATHAPLVLASVEPLFLEDRDKVFTFEIQDGHVSVRDVPWAKQGDAVGWLVSDAFGMKQARSREAEQAIEAAEAFMRGDREALPAGLESKEQIQAELERLLAGHDPFWPRWVVGTEGQGR